MVYSLWVMGSQFTIYHLPYTIYQIPLKTRYALGVKRNKD